ncbi:MAG: hypothetical protein ACHQVS_02040 [Candidatus Babeliales bacterium]
MGAPDILQRQHALLSNLIQLPHKIIQLHGNEYLPEFVLHELSHEQCFDLSKVAYFVDNADFNCMKGVVGIDRAHHYGESIWDNPQDYISYMRSAPFNAMVRTIETCSGKRRAKSHEELAETIAHDLGFTNYGLCSWSLKYDNDGFIMYEKARPADTFADDYLVKGLHLLSFCPIF